MDLRTIICEEKGAVAHVILNRPEVMNALNPEMAKELEGCITDLGAREEVKVIIIRGSGKAFSAGGDVALLSAIKDKSPMEIRQTLAQDVFGRFSAVYRVEKPIIAALHGYVLGAALSLALLCDVRIAEKDTVFGVEFARMGIAPEAGISYVLPKMVGCSRAAELVLTARRFGASEAERIGILSKIVEKGTIKDEAERLAGQMAALPPIALSVSKSTLRADLLKNFDDVVEREANLNAVCYKTRDHMEAVRAFLEKRAPVFTGK